MDLTSLHWQAGSLPLVPPEKPPEITQIHRHRIDEIGFNYFILTNMTSQVAQMVKRLPTMQETWVQSLGQGKSPGEGNGNPLQYSCLENRSGRKSLVCYSPWGSQRVGHD